MQLNRLCLLLPADYDDLEPPILVDNSPPKPKKQSRLICHPFSNLLRQLCNRRSCSMSFCCGSNSSELRRQDSSLFFEDIPGVAVTPGKKTGYDNPRIFSYAELYIGSNGFSDKEILGSGGFGRVYRAVLPSDGSVVAVKCVAGGGDRFEKTFAAELAAVAQLRHRNLVRLRGWCFHGHQLLLVYDYMPNSSLDRLLFGGSAAKSALGWERRERIVEGLAAALFYLHEQLNTQIIHRDVKTSNVMLDSGYNARLGDFGLARWLEHDAATATATMVEFSQSPANTHHQFRLTDTSKIGGTIGYLPPEGFQKKNTAVTAKSDVFSFGIVVLEVATGRRAVDLSYPDDQIILVDWVRRLADEGNCLEASDRRLPDGSYLLSSMKRLIHLGLLCSLHDPQSRPTMKWVMEILSGNHSRDIPPLPSFKFHPQYIPLSPYATTTTNTATTTTTTTNTTATTNISKAETESYYFTATNSTKFLTAEKGGSGSSSRRHPPPQSYPPVDTPREISFKEIIAITNNFSDDQIVAELDFGTGYHGYLDDHHHHRCIHVLVKRLGMKTCPALRTRFSNELRNLGRLRHRHLVQLRGWCTEQGEMLVVYDYSSCTSLARYLFHNNKAKAFPWRRRYGVIKSLASAILYLHEEWEEQVIHRNITSSAIFLDSDMNPRLGCFALAEFLTRNEQGHHIVATSPSVRGIFGYMSPEYMQSGEATTMADIYSFGVVVLEVVSGQMAVDFRYPEVLLVKKVRELLARLPTDELADRRLDGQYDRAELMRLVRLGLACTSSDPESRPSMGEIVSILDGNDELLSTIGRKNKKKKNKGKEDWEGWNDSSLSLIRRIQAIGIQ